MWKVLVAGAALALALGQAQAQPTITGQIACTDTASASAGAATTQLVAGATGQRIFLCGWDVGAGAAAGGFQLVYGTGSSCTSSTAMTGAFSLAINSYQSSRVPIAHQQTAQGASLCVVTTGTGPTTITVFYVRF